MYIWEILLFLRENTRSMLFLKKALGQLWSTRILATGELGSTLKKKISDESR